MSRPLAKAFDSMRMSNPFMIRQHLRRNHPAPICCPRCWLVMTSQAEMTLHANTEERCEQKEPPTQEGVDHEKMRMITENWGISWEGIYEILFPGAPIPSRCKCNLERFWYSIKSHLTTLDYDADEVTLGNPESLPPRSQEPRDPTTLHPSIEANLRAIVESQVAPIAENVRAMSVDLVRTCQATIAHNFHLMIAPVSSANDRLHLSTQTAASTEAAGQTYESIDQFRDETRGSSFDFLREPPHLNAEASTSSISSNYNYNSVAGNQNQSSDSGYPIISFSCSCSCHESNNLENAANGEELSKCPLNPRLTKHEGRSNCQSCDYMHFEFNDFWNNDGNAPEHGAT